FGFPPTKYYFVFFSQNFFRQSDNDIPCYPLLFDCHSKHFCY
ncbi:hypothetical protein TNCT_276861, partial [Trichonephila clavata]